MQLWTCGLSFTYVSLKLSVPSFVSCCDKISAGLVLCWVLYSFKKSDLDVKHLHLSCCLILYRCTILLCFFCYTFQCCFYILWKLCCLVSILPLGNFSTVCKTSTGMWQMGKSLLYINAMIEATRFSSSWCNFNSGSCDRKASLFFKESLGILPLYIAVLYRIYIHSFSLINL